MKGLGSGDNGEFTFLDLLAITSFFIGVGNYNLNLTQDDKQDLMQSFNNQTTGALNEIHGHLQEQDRKLDLIIQQLEELNARDTKT